MTIAPVADTCRCGSIASQYGLCLRCGLPRAAEVVDWTPPEEPKPRRAWLGFVILSVLVLAVGAAGVAGYIWFGTDWGRHAQANHALQQRLDKAMNDSPRLGDPASLFVDPGPEFTLAYHKHNGSMGVAETLQWLDEEDAVTRTAADIDEWLAGGFRETYLVNWARQDGVVLKAAVILLNQPASARAFFRNFYCKPGHRRGTPTLAGSLRCVGKAAANGTHRETIIALRGRAVLTVTAEAADATAYTRGLAARVSQAGVVVAA